MKQRSNLDIAFDAIYRHLNGFYTEGKQWVHDIVNKTNLEYINLVNVKCGWAKYLLDEGRKIHDMMKRAIGKGDIIGKAYIAMIEYLESIDSLIKSSVNVVPYSKIDEFNLIVYQLHRNLSTAVSNRYYTIEIE